MITYSENIRRSDKTLAGFFNNRESFGTVWSSKSDFDSAWRSYANCFISYIAAFKQTNQRSSDEYNRCRSVANSLGAVLNGRPWR